MRLVVGRALGTLDLPPYPSLASFVEALSRFAAIDQSECFRRIVINRPDACATEAAVDPPAADLTITVSDIRRARRATGVPLSEIARRSGVPVHLLRQLEWGYLENWPASHAGRRFMASYARAAGLDEQVVMGALWPLLGESELTRATLAADLPSSRQPADIVIEPTVVETTTGTLIRIRPSATRGTNMRRLVAVLTIPALLLIGAAPALWHSGARASEPPSPSPASMPPPIRETGVVVAAPVAPAPVVRTGGVVIAAATPRGREVPAMKVKRPRSSSAVKAPQARRNTRAKGPRKWGVWVLDKIGVRIVNDAAVNPQLPNP
jgi:hypothetical protein